MTKLECCDYDSMGNHGRFPKRNTNKVSNKKNLVSAVVGRLILIKSIFITRVPNIK